MNSPKLKPEVKKVWLESLRNGSYIQSEDVLRTHENEYCCLGVLCDIYNQQHGGGYWGEGSDEYVFDDQTHLPPQKVYDWAFADLVKDDEYIRVVAENESQTLYVLNDNGYSFDQIADLIEAQL